MIGGTGRVGSLIVSKLLKKGIIPHVLVRDIEKAKQNKQLNGKIVEYIMIIRLIGGWIDGWVDEYMCIQINSYRYKDG